ncbi:alpha/beta hydrolase family protein [Micromonospora sp. CA-240977]|uniref:alpha/beta hydrolase family protein n=1 Tax=Micromonospora sp. CA-240977 TaxID=3239957 RepID=UPI003D8DA160
MEIFSEFAVATPVGRDVAVLAAVPERPARALVTVLPAMGVPARFYRALAAALCRRGHLVAVVNLPGQGASPLRIRRGVDLRYDDLVDQDIRATARHLREAYPSRPLVLLGHSLGGHLALRYASRPGVDVAGVALMACGSVWFRSFGVRRGLLNLLCSQLFVALARVVGHWPGDRLRFGGRQPTGVLGDWAAQVRSGDMTGGGGGRAFTCRSPVLLVSVDNDRLAPPRAVRYLTAAIPDAPVERWHYAESAAGGALDHFRWAKRPEALAARIDDWMARAASTCPSDTTDGMDRDC